MAALGILERSMVAKGFSWVKPKTSVYHFAAALMSGTEMATWFKGWGIWICMSEVKHVHVEFSLLQGLLSPWFLSAGSFDSASDENFCQVQQRVRNFPETNV